ncbi:uncharacterized protein [Dermacentor andersoni]|uniref:uncharacterized protein n=1 Tax=Dermacentor andersoni TaxID=34620 RepID=UPI003B3AF94A
MHSSLTNPFLFYMQVGKKPSLLSKRSNNLCLLLIPCPPVKEAVKNENSILASRLDHLEDRSRRDNFLFYGITDSPTETWAESETRIRDILSMHFDISIPDTAVSRAHRLGSFSANKTRPIIVMFSAFKIKESILSLRAKLKGSGVSPPYLSPLPPR